METRKNQPFLSRLRFAITGVAHALRTEQSLRTQTLALLLVLIVLALLRPAHSGGARVLAAVPFFGGRAVQHRRSEAARRSLHPDMHPEIRLREGLCCRRRAYQLGPARWASPLRCSSR